MGAKFDLSFILGQANPEASVSERIEWLEQLVDWIRYTGGGQSSPTTRIRFLLQLLERNPDWKIKSAQVIRSILLDTSAERLFSETGLPTANTFFKEFVSRMIRGLFPHYEDPASLASVQGRVFYDEDDANWIAQIPEPLIVEVIEWIQLGKRGDENLSRNLLTEACDACTILIIMSAAIALREDVSERSPEYRVATHPLLKLEAEIAQMSIFAQGIVRADEAQIARCRESVRRNLEESRKLILAVRTHLEEFGVSVDLVYQLDRMKLYLERIEILSEIIFAGLGLNQADRAARAQYWVKSRSLLGLLVQGQIYDRDFGYVLRKNFAILSRKIVERAGVSGEHYITQNRAEYTHMFVMAAGGGVLTAVTALLKYAVPISNAPMFVEIAYNTLNYAGSFVLMHYLGFKLATKQPSVTAAALAGKLKESDEKEDAFVDEVSRITRSTFAAVMGNILAVIPVAWLIDRAFVQMRSGQHFLSADKARYVLESIHPWTTLTVVYAAMTGVLLWLASMIAGWMENAVVFYRLPEIIRHHKVLRKVIGEKRTTWFADALIRNVSGIVGAISLGFFLAAFPILGRFFGLPLNVAHVTLTTGSATYAFSSLGLREGMLGDLGLAALGIALIGAMNFGISFLMAMLIAVRAQDVSSRRLWRIFKRAAVRFRKSPWQFFLPTKNPASSPNQESHG